MDPALEIRKLPPSVLRELSQILDYGNQWKDLMAIIPKQLTRDYGEAYISEANFPKYNSEHIQIIDQGALRLKKSPTAILVDEWGTSGRPRATLGHLLFFLMQAKLYRAADYVSIELLKQSPVSRPKYGLGSAVKLNNLDWTNNFPHLSNLLKKIDCPELNDISKLEQKHKNLESLLDDIKYPFSESRTDGRLEENGPGEVVSNSPNKSLTNLMDFTDNIDDKQENMKDAKTVPHISLLLNENGSFMPTKLASDFVSLTQVEMKIT